MVLRDNKWKLLCVPPNESKWLQFNIAAMFAEKGLEMDMVT